MRLASRSVVASATRWSRSPSPTSVRTARILRPAPRCLDLAVALRRLDAGRPGAARAALCRGFEAPGDRHRARACRHPACAAASRAWSSASERSSTMPETTFESVLEIQIRALGGGWRAAGRPVRDRRRHDRDREASQMGNRIRLAAAPRGRPPGRRRTVRLAFVVVLAVLAAALLVHVGPGPPGRRAAGAGPRRARVRSTSPSTPAPTAPEPTSGDASDGVADQSIFLRPSGDGLGAMDVVAVNAAGQERLVRRLGADARQGRRGLPPVWCGGSRRLALGRRVSWSVDVLPGLWMLVDLRDPTRPPQFVPYTQVIGGAWSGTGRFATVTPGTNCRVLDRRRRCERRYRPGRSAAPSACPVAVLT